MADGGRETEGKRELSRWVTMAEVVEAVERVTGESREVWLARRGGAGKALAMWAARRYAGRTLRETGEALGGLDYAAVSVAIRRLEREATRNPERRIAMEGLARL